MPTSRPPSRPSYLQGLTGLVLTVAALYLAKPVLVPLALAVLLTFVLTPIVSTFQRQGLGRVPAVFVTVILAFAVFGAVGWGVGIQVNKLAQDLPNQKDKIQEKIAGLRGSGESVFAKLLHMVRELGAEAEKNPPTAGDSPVEKQGLTPEEPAKKAPAAGDPPPAEKQVVVARVEESSS